MSIEKKYKVRAVQIGYYDNMRRYPAGHGHPKSGKEFIVKESELSDSTKKSKNGLYGWMEVIAQVAGDVDTEKKPKVEEVYEDAEPTPVQKKRGRPKRAEVI